MTMGLRRERVSTGTPSAAVVQRAEVLLKYFEMIQGLSTPENELERLEREFPPVSGQAFAAARERMLVSGQSVLQSENGCIYEVFPDGRKVFVKQIESPTPVTPGTKFTIR